jgi:hypothetical protein
MKIFKRFISKDIPCYSLKEERKSRDFLLLIVVAFIVQNAPVFFS